MKKTRRCKTIKIWIFFSEKQRQLVGLMLTMYCLATKTMTENCETQHINLNKYIKIQLLLCCRIMSLKIQNNLVFQLTQFKKHVDYLARIFSTLD